MEKERFKKEEIDRTRKEEKTDERKEKNSNEDRKPKTKEERWFSLPSVSLKFCLFLKRQCLFLTGSRG